jgi:hypothetical protein
VLEHLVAHRDRVVPREELLDAVWGFVAVCESNLTTCVAELRSALGDRRRTLRHARNRARRCVRTIERLLERIDRAGTEPCPAAPPLRVVVLAEDAERYADVVALLQPVGRPFEIDWAPTRDAVLGAMACGAHDVYLVDECSVQGGRSATTLVSAAAAHEWEVQAIRTGAAVHLVRADTRPGANAGLRTAVAAACHAVRETLTTIMGLADILGERLRDEEARAEAGHVRRVAAHLLDVISRLEHPDTVPPETRH